MGRQIHTVGHARYCCSVQFFRMGYRLVELGDDVLNGPVTIGQLIPVVFHCRGKLIIILKKFLKAGVNVFLGKVKGLLEEVRLVYDAVREFKRGNVS